MRSHQNCRSVFARSRRGGQYALPLTLTIEGWVRSFRFGVVFTGEVRDSRAWAEFARRVEAAGFSTLLVADHYANPMACTPLIAAAAAVTTTLRVGSYVYNNDFRHPALLAKEVATMDVLSDGRVELGLGAGWAKLEYLGAGIMFDSPATRMNRLEEAVGIIRQLLAGEAVEHKGTHYRLRGLPGSPRPAQSQVPLLIGGGGPRMIKFATRSADIVGLVPRSLAEGGLDPQGFALDAMDERIRWIEQTEADAARADGGPERSTLIFAAGQSLDELSAREGIDPVIARSSPHLLAGDHSAMTDALHERRDRWGLTYQVCFDRDLDQLAPVVNALST
jgi:probable F420-dependent oxidoreductase